MELKINESKVLEFSTVIEGGSADDLSGKIRITINEVEYGFPISLKGKKIQVKIPPLKDYVREENLRNVKSAFARLDIVAKGKLFTPWKEDISLEIPLEVKAEMTDIKGFLEEADSIIKVSKVEEAKSKTRTKTKTKETDSGEEEVTVTKTKKRNENKLSDAIFGSYGSKKKSKFSIMLEKEKCPEGQEY